MKSNLSHKKNVVFALEFKDLLLSHVIAGEAWHMSILNV
jgi:hypothetical protein